MLMTPKQLIWTMLCCTLFLFWSLPANAGKKSKKGGCKEYLVGKRSHSKSSASDESLEKKKAELRAKIREIAQSESAQGGAVRELLLAQHLKNIARNYPTVSVLFGNAHHSDLELSKVFGFIQTLADRGYVVFHDADSILAPLIHKATNGYGIAISGNAEFTALSPQEDIPRFQVLNPYLRMAIFSKAHRIFSSDDSVLGAGLLIHGEVTHVYSKNEKREFWPARWDWSVKPNLGLKYAKFPSVVGDLTRWAGSQKLLEKRDLPTLNEDAILGSLLSYELESMLAYGELYPRGKAQMEMDVSGDTIPGGAVVFGSSTNHPKFTELIYDTSRTLAEEGIPIATGGAEGYMEVANAAAFDVGAPSIGIPYGGFGLENEKETVRSRHTLTIPTQGYESRIPLLLHRRKIIVMAPGGTGTIKELATALFVLGAKKSTAEQIVFLSRDYYGPVFDALRSSSLPYNITSSIHIIDNPSEILPIVRRLENEYGIPSSELRVSGPIIRRNNNTEFQPRAKP